MTETAVTWSDALRAFASDQHDKGLAASSVARQVRQLWRIAAHFGGTPSAVTTAQLRRWLDEHRGSAATVKGERITLRAFYRWAEQASLVEVSPMPAPASPSRYALDARWQDALHDFETAQARQRIAPATIAQRVKHVSRMASALQLAPWEVQGVEVRGWLDALPVSEPTRLAHRSSVRAFYRWAHTAQRVAVNPTNEDTVHPLHLGAPPQWAREIHAYLRAERAQGRPASTLRLRRAQLERLGREHPSLEPYELSLDDLLEWLGGKRWAAETRRGHRSAVVAFYRWAEATGRVEASPAAALPRVAASQPRPRPALEHELSAALAKATERERLAIRLAAELGLRRAEVAQVHSRDLMRLPGDDQWWLTVHGKGSRQRRVPLTAELATSLRARGEGYLFPNPRGGHLSAAYVAKLVTGLLPEGVSMHALRHRFATRAYSIDRDVFAVQRFLGHASPTTTQRYVLVNDDNLRALGAAVAS